MRGIILAGGTGSRLGHLTRWGMNKHCLPVGDVPMIYHPLRTLLANGLRDITIVSSTSGVGQLASMLGSGHEAGCSLTYRVQDQPGGIAQALACADDRSQQSVAVILGDNVFLPYPVIHPGFAMTYLYRAKDLRGFGVPSFHSNGDYISGIVEKPEVPPSEFAITGLYVFPPDVFARIATLEVSSRNELEITDLLNDYAVKSQLSHTILAGFWGDAGTHDGIEECSAAVRNHKGNQ